MSDTTHTPQENPAPEAQAPEQQQKADDASAQRIAYLEAELSKTQEQAKKYRQGKAAEKEAAEAAKKENGEFKALAESLEAERNELRSQLDELAPVASAFKQDQETRENALSQRMGKLSEADRALVKGAGSLAAREALVSRFLADSNTVTVSGDVDNGQPPPAETNMANMSGDQILAAVNARKQNSNLPSFAARIFKQK